MASYTELTILREEERVLMKIASKLNDQLNRLKVEELALLSQIRNSQTDAIAPNSEDIDRPVRSQESTTDVNTKPLLNLEVNNASRLHAVGEEEEEEEDEDNTEEGGDGLKRRVVIAPEQNQLMAFLQQMELQHKPAE